jgi:hypothetical protein
MGSSSRDALQSTMGLGASSAVAGYYSASSRGPIATHDPTGESEDKRTKRKRREAKYREVGDTMEAESPREMLTRLEAKLATKK